MVLKCVKWVVVGATASCLVGGLLFGKDVVSYVRSSAKSVRTAVKDAVPIEFELRRARDLLDQIIPEMHANIRLISQEEVEIAALKTEITKGTEALDIERTRVKNLRAALDTPRAQYAFNGIQYTRDQITDDLAGRFERLKESELVAASKQRLLASRETSLASAMQLLDKTRSQKQLLENKIETLESQYRLVKAAAVGSTIQVDSSKLAQTEKLIGDIKKRLDVAERVLAHESRFVQTVPVLAVSETELVAQIDEYLGEPGHGTPAVSVASTTAKP